MATIADVLLPADEFALRGTSRALDGVEFQIERVIASDPERIMPYVWLLGAEREKIEAALAADPSVDEAKLVTDIGGQWLYQMDWVDRIETLVRVIVAEDAVILAAYGTDEAWHLQFLFLEREAIRRVQDHCEEVGLSFNVRRIYDHANGAMGSRGLTDRQHYALTLALERGYYDDPPETDVDTLAAELDVSPNELADRLRGAHGALVTNSVSIGIPPGFGDDNNDADAEID